MEEIIQSLQLQPHPEGGYFKESYRSQDTIAEDSLPEGFNGPRNVSTCIYYLLGPDDFSAFHKIQQDEIWHFYLGSPIMLYLISELGKLTEVTMGNALSTGQLPQFVVPKQHWFAAKVMKPEGFALVGCTVSPGFDFRDFTLASRDQLVGMFPQHEAIIAQFTRL